MMMKILTEEEVGDKLNGTSLKGYLVGYAYEDLVEGLGEPTYSKESADGKTQKEWNVEYEGRFYSIYDWKTWDRHKTVTDLRRWNVGGHKNADSFIKALYFTLRPRPFQKIF
jgi:hypothetical protein